MMMSQFNLKNNNNKDLEFYTLNRLVPEMENEDDYVDFINTCYSIQKCEKMEEYIKIFVDYIFDIIDDANSFIVINGDKNNNKIYKDKINYDILYYIDDNLDYDKRKVHYSLYHIDNQRAKDILKESIIFNIGDESCEPVPLNVNNKHVSKDATVSRESFLYLIKDNNLLVDFWLDSGYILDYRDKEVIRKHQEKYRKKN